MGNHPRTLCTYFSILVQFQWNLNSSSDFPAELDEIEDPEIITKSYSRDYYIKASRSPTGEVSARASESPVSTRSEASIEVSRIMNNTLHLIGDEEELHEEPSTFDSLKRRTKSSLHYSKVFQTAQNLNYHSLRLPKKNKRSPLDQSAFSRFEGNSIRNDLKHSTFRARGASPNFVLNPVFELEQARKLEKKYSSDETIEEIIEPVYRSLRPKNKRRDRESGYGSSDSVDSWRITLPLTPESGETDFESVSTPRRRPRSCLGLASGSEVFFL